MPDDMKYNVHLIALQLTFYSTKNSFSLPKVLSTDMYEITLFSYYANFAPRLRPCTFCASGDKTVRKETSVNDIECCRTLSRTYSILEDITLVDISVCNV